MKIAVLTDSSCDLPSDVLEQLGNVWVVPLKVIIGGKVYNDRIDISPEELYRQLDEKKPSSTQPSVAEVVNCLDRIKAAGFTDIFAVSISSGLSGTNNVFRLALAESSGLNYYLYDSKTLSMALGFMVMEAARLAQKNESFTAIAERLDELRYKRISCFYTLNTLTYLRRGGRIGKVEGAIAELLDIKPIISVNDAGVYYAHAKVRGEKKAFNKLIDILKERYGDQKIRLAVMYGNNLAMAKSLQQKINSICAVKENFLWPVSPVLGMHTGPSLLAVIAYDL